MKAESWIGKEVICISNGFETDPNDPSLIHGIVTKVDYISQAKTPVLIVRYGDEEFLTFSITFEYTNELWDILWEMTNRTRYAFAMAVVNRFQAQHYDKGVL